MVKVVEGANCTLSGNEPAYHVVPAKNTILQYHGRMSIECATVQMHLDHAM